MVNAMHDNVPVSQLLEPIYQRLKRQSYYRKWKQLGKH